MKYLEIVLNSGNTLDVVTNDDDKVDIMQKFLDFNCPFFFFENGMVNKKQVACILIFDEKQCRPEDD